MEDTDGLLLNLTSGNGPNKRNDTTVINKSNDDTQLVKFVSSKKTKNSSDDNLPKTKTFPAVKVLRRKAVGVKKLSDTLSKPIVVPKPTPSSVAPSKKQTNKKTDWVVTPQKQGKKPEQATVISSLFRKNPEIPKIETKSVEITDEKVFSSNSFSALDIHEHLKATLEKDLGLTQMTEVQASTIPILLQRKDALVKSQTGSGKTLAYAIPIVQSLQAIRPKINRMSGIFALIIVPTRELVLQTYSWFSKIVKAFTWVVPGYLIGGEKKKSEKARIRKGINILISTPGRLLDHINSTRNLNLGRLNWLVMDEADRLLDMGYEKDVAKIITTVNQHFETEGGIGKKQTLMLSATLSAGVEKLAGFTLTNPERINVSKEADLSTEKLVTPSQLKQHYILIPPKLRLVTLAAFVLWKCTGTKEKKVLIFMTTQDMVDYHAELFSRVVSEKMSEGDIKFYKLHGNMAQKDRTTIFKEFRDAESGVLFCTDVAARGLDLPKVDWIIQYNPPVTVEDYVHRVGRTARVGEYGQALIFLAPPEAEFVNRLASRGISVKQMNPDSILKTLVTTFGKMSRTMEEAATRLQTNFEECIAGSFTLHEIASRGYMSFIRSYAAFPKNVRDIFNFQSLHLGHYAKSFALRDPPKRISGFGRPQDETNNRFQRGFKSSRGAKTHNSFRVENIHLPEAKQREMILSEFASGIDGPPCKKKKK